MSAVEITSLSSKGQVVIPNVIRDDLNVSVGDKFAVISDGRNILLKPIDRPQAAEFNALIDRSRKYARKIGLKKSDITTAIKKVRRESRR